MCISSNYTTPSVYYYHQHQNHQTKFISANKIYTQQKGRAEYIQINNKKALATIEKITYKKRSCSL